MADGQVSSLRQYFEKLKNTIEKQATFKFMNKRLVDKQRVDDILCCIDINFPEPLKKFRDKYGDVGKNVRCFKLYQQMINNIKKPIFGDKYYAVNYSETIELLDRLNRSISKDLRYVEDNYQTM